MAKFSCDPGDRWKVLPKGEYPVMVISSEEKKARKEDGFDYIEVHMQVLDGEFKGEIIIDRLSLSPKAEKRLAGFVYACCMHDPSVKGKQEFDTNDLLNKMLIVKGDIESFNGQERFRPTSFKQHPEAAPTEAAATEEPAQEEAPPAKAPPAKAAAPAKTAAKAGSRAI